MLDGQSPRVLFLTYSFPPLGKAGGSIRVVKHIKYLHRSGLRFCVLTSDRSPFGPWNPQPNSADVLLEDVPSDVLIYRTPGWRIPTSWLSTGQSLTQQHKALSAGWKARIGKFTKSLLSRCRAGFLALFLFPDADIPWALITVPFGIYLVRQYKVDLVYAIAPPLSALVSGWLIALVAQKPLVVEYKDDRIGTEPYKALPVIVQRLHESLERTIVKRAQCVIAVTPSSLAGFRQRHMEEAAIKFVCIPNGADLEEYECLISQKATDEALRKENQFIILNAGGYVPLYRNATPFFEAIGLLLSTRPEFRDIIRIHFIGEGAHTFYGSVLKRFGINDIFIELPIMGRREYIAALRRADLLLLVQTLGYPTSIAGTFYEYWAAGRAPIFIIGEPGDMWSLLHTHQLGFALHHNDVDGIRSTIEMLVDAHLAGRPIRISANGVEQYDRRYLASQLGDILTRVVNSAG